MLNNLMCLFLLVIEILFSGILLVILLLLLAFYQENVLKRRRKKKESAKQKPGSPEKSDERQDSQNAVVSSPIQAETTSEIDVPLEGEFPVQAQGELQREKRGASRAAAYSAGESGSDSITRKFTCGLRDQDCINTYRERVYLVERKQGELLATQYQNGVIKAVPAKDYANERVLNDLFHVCFEFDPPQHPDAKKFRVECKQEVVLMRDDKGYWVKTKGRLKIEAVQ